MTYKLETIKSTDQKKIIDDLRNDSKLYQLFVYLNKEKKFPEKWAIDVSSDSYLLIVPQVVGSDSFDNEFLFIVNGRIYKIISACSFTDEFKYIDGYKPPKKETDVIEMQISDAFAVYGRWGTGELNELGLPEFKVSPVFNGES